MMVVMIMLSELAILSSVAIENFFFQETLSHTDEPTTPMPVPPSDLEEVLTL